MFVNTIIKVDHLHIESVKPGAKSQVQLAIIASLSIGSFSLVKYYTKTMRGLLESLLALAGLLQSWFLCANVLCTHYVQCDTLCIRHLFILHCALTKTET